MLHSLTNTETFLFNLTSMKVNQEGDVNTATEQLFDVDQFFAAGEERRVSAAARR